MDRRTRTAEAALRVLLVLLAGCGDNPLQPRDTLQLTPLGAAADSLNAPPLGQIPVSFRVTRNGGPVAGATVRWTVTGAGAAVTPATAMTGADGIVSAAWTLGTDAHEAQQLGVEVTQGMRRSRAFLAARVVPTQVAAVSILQDTLATRLVSALGVPVVVVDSHGNDFHPADLRFSSLDTTIFGVDSVGVIHPRRRGRAGVVVAAGGAADTAQVHIYQIVGALALAADTAGFHSLTQPVALRFRVTSDLGFPVRDSLPAAVVADTAIAVVAAVTDSTVVLESRGNGSTTVFVTIGAATRSAVVAVQQRTWGLGLTPDSLVFDALGDSVAVAAVALDSVGVAVAGAVVHFAATDSTVAPVSAAGTVRSAGNGSAGVVVREAAGVTDTVPVVVRQVADSLAVTVGDTLPIWLLRPGDPVPLACAAFDRNRFAMPAPTLQSARGLVTGGDCGAARAFRSGHDTLVVTADALRRAIPAVLALPATVTPPTGAAFPADSVPAGMWPWAPTLVRNSRGALDLYTSHYRLTPGAPNGLRGSLDRFVSDDDGRSFRYDGTALERDSTPCTPQGDGIENVAIVPRADAPGWRMFYASGGFTCYGWQVFSAVSTDERTWVKEPGVRIGNGGSLPPDAPVTAPRPAGEGMVIDQLPTGEWRMIASTYENAPAPPDKFVITEWRSSDQLTWTYRGVLLRTEDFGPGAQRSIFSPTIREFAPGLYRMILTGDDTNLPGGASRLYTAVSTDRVGWIPEGELLAAPGINFRYCTVEGDLLVFLDYVPFTAPVLRTARVDMP